MDMIKKSNPLGDGNDLICGFPECIWGTYNNIFQIYDGFFLILHWEWVAHFLNKNGDSGRWDFWPPSIYQIKFNICWV